MTVNAKNNDKASAFDSYSATYNRIELISAGPRRVVAEAVIGGSNSEHDLAEANGLVGLLGQTACVHGARRAVPGRTNIELVETQTRFFSSAASGRLRAIGEPIQDGPYRVVWRASIYEVPKEHANPLETMVAETTNTLIVIGDERSQSSATSQVKADANTSSEAKVIGLERSHEDKDQGGSQASVAEKRRRQIFVGACDVIGKKGYAQASVREIAASAGIPVPTMYQYIRSKEDILYMISSEAMKENFDNFQHNLTVDGDAIECMRQAVDIYLSYITKNRSFINLVYSETRSLGRENREKVFELERQFTVLWEEIIRRGVESGDFEVEDTWLAANMTYFLCNVWALRFWAIGEYRQEKVGAMLSQLILRGLMSKQK